MPTGAAADVEHPASDVSHSLPLVLRPIVVLGEIVLGTTREPDRAVVPLYDLKAAITVQIISDGGTIGVLRGEQDDNSPPSI